jgi:hypothetical protein
MLTESSGPDHPATEGATSPEDVVT